jgi:hypothetical protein
MQAFHTIMGQPKKRPAATALTVAEVFERFLEWCQQHRAERTYKDHRDFIQTFLVESPGVADLSALELRPFTSSSGWTVIRLGEQPSDVTPSSPCSGAIELELAAFARKYAKELDQLRAVYGSANVTVKWGILEAVDY